MYVLHPPRWFVIDRRMDEISGPTRSDLVRIHTLSWGESRFLIHLLQLKGG